MNAPVNASIQSSVDDLLHSLEPFRVTIDERDAIRQYLAKHPDLLSHIRPTVESVRQEFGEVASITLTVNDDPEFYDPYVRLYVRLPKPDREADERLEHIAGALSDAIADLPGYFRVTADHRNLAR
jgi:hypothetical protein